MNLRAQRLTALAMAVVMLSGCATVVNSTNQKIKFESTPAGATVSVDSKPLGVTPATYKIPRKKSHMVRMDLAGYEPHDVKLKRRPSWWLLGNILIGGITGVALDAICGGMFTLTPKVVQATFVPHSGQAPQAPPPAPAEAAPAEPAPAEPVPTQL